MNIMDRLFPARKPRTPETIAARLDAARAAMAEAQARAAGAAELRKAAIASGDRAGAITAESERAAAEIDSEIASGEIAGLEAGLADAVRAAEEAATVAVRAALLARRKALGDRLESEYRAAAAVLAEILGEVRTLQRDVAEAGAEREVEGLPSVPRGLALNEEAVGNVSRWLDDALSGRPNVPESPKEAAYREHQADRARRKAEEAQVRQIRIESEREEGRAAREAEDAKIRERERNPYYPTWRDHLDSAR